MGSKTCAFITLGCKVNQYETQAVREDLLRHGYREVPPGHGADLYLVNTCTVTLTSAGRSRRAVRRISRKHPRSRIVVMGCMTRGERGELMKIPGVVNVVGNEGKAGLGARIDGGPDGGPGDIFDLRIGGFSHRTRAYLKIQDGCDEMCSFCIVPLLRGRSRSRPPGDILEEAGRLGAGGFREVVVTGIHIQDFGRDLRGWGLSRLLSEIARLRGIERIRLSSIDPRAVDDELLDALQPDRFARHWHIPLQSGDDAVLRSMRRGYTTAVFRRGIERLRSGFPDPGISTDVIVGFPGETGESFLRTVDFCREVGFAKIHVFPFSPRPGTLAAKLSGQLPRGEVLRRAEILGAVEAEMGRELRRGFIGRTDKVLVETVRDGHAEGYSSRYLRIRFPGEEALRGRLVPVRMDSLSVEGPLDHGTVIGTALPLEEGSRRRAAV